MITTMTASDVTSFLTISSLPFISLYGCFQHCVSETMLLSALTVLQISDEQVAAACAEFQGLSDIVLCSLPDALLQPLLGRLHLEGSRFMSQQQQPVTAKQWLWSADPALRSVVAKEALQWHRGMLSQVNRRKDLLSWDVMPSSRCFLMSGRNVKDWVAWKEWSVTYRWEIRTGAKSKQHFHLLCSHWFAENFFLAKLSLFYS